MSIYEKTNVARALLYWAKNNNGNECYYLEDRMYAVADGDMVILLTADSYDEAKRKAKARHAQERPQDEYVDISKLRLMTVEECAGHSIDYAMGWKACVEWIKKGGAE